MSPTCGFQAANRLGGIGKPIIFNQRIRLSSPVVFTPLKHYFEQCDGLPHVLQCLPHVRVPDNQQSRVHDFVKSCLTPRRTLIRAWGYSGVAELAAQFDDYRLSTLSLLQDADERESAASVRVRIRKGLARLSEAG